MKSETVQYGVKVRSGLRRDCTTLAEARRIARGERADGWPTHITRLSDDVDFPIDRRRD